MTAADAAPLVSTQWLADRLAAPDLVVIDASWYLPAMNRDAAGEYLAGHIPGAVRFDIDEISDKASPLPHMLPDPVAFASAMRKLGVGDGMRIVVYDGAGLFSAPRVRWTLMTFGARHVSLLDGGLPKWKAEQRPLEEGPVTRKPRHFTARFDHGAVADAADVARRIARGDMVVDARSAERFRGEAPEPRPGIPSGHIPGSRSLPFGQIVADGRLRPPAEIVAAFAAAGVDLSKPIVTTCGSGVSAAILSLALEVAGKRADALYDGSWADWAGRGDLPVAKGEANPTHPSTSSE